MSPVKSPLLNALLALFVLALFALLLSLGLWQWQRGGEKQQQMDQQAARQLQPARPLQNLLASHSPDQLDSLRVSVNGQLLGSRAVMLDNQHHQHQLGFHHLVAMDTGLNRPLLLIDFGWLPAIANSRQLPPLNPLPAEASLNGTLYRPTLNAFIRDPLPGLPQWPLLRQQLDIKQLAVAFDRPLHPWVLRLSPDSPLGYVKQWPEIAIKPQKHYGYAVQWFAMALALAWLSIAYFKRYHRPDRRSSHAIES